MADIFVTTGVTGVQTLSSGSNAIITQAGTIFNSTAGTGISAAGNNRILVAGQILATNYSAIDVLGTNVQIKVTSTGSIIAMGSIAITDSSVTNPYINLSNDGTIDAASNILYMQGNGGSTVQNTGHMIGNFYLGGGVDDVRNIGGSIFGNLNMGSGSNNFTNTNGLLTGFIFAGTNSDFVDNSDGVIKGYVILGGGNDQFINLRGSVTEQVYLDLGDDIASLDTDGAHGILSISGGLGFDTVNFGNGSTAIWLDLEYSAMEVWTSGTGVANGATANAMVANIDSFEKIIGTVGSDVILGDAKDNTYIYNGNFSGVADVFFGRGGVDTIDLRSLNSIWVDLNNSANEVYTSGTNVAYGYNSNTVIANLDSVERINGTYGSDQVFGDAADNIFVSNGVALNYTATVPVAIELDRFDGRGGSDTIDVSGLYVAGGVWADLTYAGPQVWVAYGLYYATGGNANLAIAQLTAVENLVGSIYSDQFYGDGNANTYSFSNFDGVHTEIFDGRGGTDTFDGSLAGYALWIGLNNPAMEVWSNYSTLTPATGANANYAVADLISVENITGSQFGDTLIGDGGNNRIEGGKGNDVLVGGLGADTFVFNFDAVNSVGVGIDQINDFVAGSAIGHDIIQISGYGQNYDTFAEVMLNTTNTASGVHIQFNDGSIDLLGLVKSQLTVDDFVFV
jgi:RTX calcium-binding nonapeptide repeat (4 copies)